MNHIYPLRSSRNYWEIPLYCYHKCSDDCIVSFNEHTFRFEPNIDFDEKTGHCKNHNKLQKSNINISLFNISQPDCYGEKLYNPNLVVIPDKSFTIILNYPFATTVDIPVSTKNPMTLRILLDLIRQIYTDIYDIEEKTSDTTAFSVSRECRCVRMDLKTIVKNNTIDTNNSNDCSICYTPIGNNGALLCCNHMFHQECLYNWIDKGNGNSCPLCRTPLNNCDICDNDRINTTTEHHAVLPAYLRQHVLQRNTTNGRFGIHNYDLEALRITNMYYNRNHKLLQISVKCMINC